MIELPHHEFESLGKSWDLSLNADGYAKNTITSYSRALANFASFTASTYPGVGPLEVSRDHVRTWVVAVREGTSSGTARSWFAGVRHFFRWLVAEQERTDDPTEGIRTPKPNDVSTPVLSTEDIRALLATCTGADFVSRRDRAILLVAIDGGLRLAEVSSLDLDAVDLRQRVLFVEGKGSNRSGPRRRAVPVGVKTAQALDRYLRIRARHPHVSSPYLWLGDRNRGALSRHAIEKLIIRRGARAGLRIHPHQLRHTWAAAYRGAGGSEGDLMVLGGWRSRQMLDRYGRAVASERAAEDYRKRSLGDRL